MLAQLKNLIPSGAHSPSAKTVQESKFEILADFQDNQLKLNPQVLNLILPAHSEEKQLTCVVSVIGPPSSQKTFIMNSLSYLLIAKLSRDRKPFEYTFPTRDDCEKDANLKHLRNKDAILMAFPPLALPKTASGNDAIIILLDIWSWEPSVEKYSKMVDFCIAASSVAVLSDISKTDPEVRIWSGSNSKLPGHPSGMYFRRMILLLEEKHRRFSLPADSVPLEYKQIRSHFDNVDRAYSSDVRRELREAGRGKNNWLAGIRDKIMSVNTKNFLDLRKYLEATEHVVNLKLPVPFSSHARPDNSFSEDLEIAPGTAPPTWGSFEDPSKRTEFKAALRKPVDDLRKLMQSRLMENYEKNMVEAYRRSHRLYLDPVQLQQQHESTLQSINLKSSPATRIEIDNFYEVLRSFHSELQNQTQHLHRHWNMQTQSILESLMSDPPLSLIRYSHEDEKAFSIVEAYDEIQLHHQDLQFVALERLREIDSEINDRASKATDFVRQMYEDCSVQLLGSALLPDKQLRTLLHGLALIFDKEFLRHSKVPHPHLTLAWEFARLRMAKKIKEQVRDLFTRNQVNMKNLDRMYEKMSQDCIYFYKSKMKANLIQQVSPDDFNRIHEDCVVQTRLKFLEKFEKIDSVIVQHWWANFYEILRKFKGKFLREIDETPLPSPIDVGQRPPRPSSSTSNVTASVGIYISPDNIRLCLNAKSTQLCRQNLFQCSPFISFNSGAIMIGNEAQRCASPSTFHVYDAICHPSKTRRKIEVEIKSKKFIISEDEAVALFFIQLKKTVEQELKTCNMETCAVVSSNLLPSASKQCLREVLILSGFRRVRFLPFTAAMAFKELKQLSSMENTKLMCISHVGYELEASVMDLSPNRIDVQMTVGYLNILKFAKKLNVDVTMVAKKAVTSTNQAQPDKVVITKGSLTLTSVNRFLQSEFPSVVPTMTPDSLARAGAEFDSLISSNEDPQFSISIPNMLRFSGEIQAPEGTSYCEPTTSPVGFGTTTMTFQLPGSSRDLLKGLVIIEGIFFDRFVPLWQYAFKIAPACPRNLIEIVMLTDGRLNVRLRNDRYSVISRVSKYLTITDLRGLEVTLENIQKHLEKEEKNEEDTCEARAKLRVLVDQLQDYVSAQTDDSDGQGLPEVLNMIKERVEHSMELLNTKNVNQFKLNVALKQLKALTELCSENEFSI